MTDVCYSACNPFTMASEGLYTSQTRHMTIFIQNCDGHTGPRPTEPQRSRAVPHGCPAILHVSTSAPSPQDRHKTAPHHIAHCYIHLRITVDAQGSSCWSKRGKKSHVSFRASSATSAIASLMVHCVTHSKRRVWARASTPIHPYPSIRPPGRLLSPSGHSSRQFARRSAHTSSPGLASSPRRLSLSEARGGDLRRPSCNNRTQHADPSTPVRARHGPIPLGPSTPVYVRPSTRPSVCLSARCFPALV